MFDLSMVKDMLTNLKCFIMLFISLSVSYMHSCGNFGFDTSSNNKLPIQ